MTYFGLMWWGCGGMQAPSSAFIEVQSEDLNKSTTLELRISDTTMGIQSVEREREGKKKQPSDLSKWIKISKTKESGGERMKLGSSRSLCLAVYLPETPIFEVGTWEAKV